MRIEVQLERAGWYTASRPGIPSSPARTTCHKWSLVYSQCSTLGAVSTGPSAASSPRSAELQSAQHAVGRSQSHVTAIGIISAGDPASDARKRSQSHIVTR